MSKGPFKLKYKRSAFPFYNVTGGITADPTTTATNVPVGGVDDSLVNQAMKSESGQMITSGNVGDIAAQQTATGGDARASAGQRYNPTLPESSLGRWAISRGLKKARRGARIRKTFTA